MMNNDMLRVMGGAGAKAQYGHVGKTYDGDLASEFQQTRNRGTDTEHERKAVRSNAAQHSMGMMNSLASERVMEQAMADKFAQAGVKTTMDQAWQARPEEEDAKSDGSEDPDQDSSLAALRAARIAEMKKKMAARDEMKTKGHGEYEEIVETEFLKKVTGSNLVVCHFYHKEFERCKIVDMHLSKMAKRCFGTKFMKLNVEKSPFFVDKLRIQVIPTLVFFQDGIAKHHMRGFEEVGGDDEFSTAKLARVCYMHEVVEEHFDSDDDFL
jgi:hypothetical protein